MSVFSFPLPPCTRIVPCPGVLPSTRPSFPPFSQGGKRKRVRRAPKTERKKKKAVFVLSTPARVRDSSEPSESSEFTGISPLTIRAVFSFSVWGYGFVKLKKKKIHRTVSGRDHPSVGGLGPLPAIAHRITHNRRPPRRREHREHSRPVGPRPPVRWRRTCRYVTHFRPLKSQSIDGMCLLLFSPFFRNRVAIATRSQKARASAFRNIQRTT